MESANLKDWGEKLIKDLIETKEFEVDENRLLSHPMVTLRCYTFGFYFLTVTPFNLYRWYNTPEIWQNKLTPGLLFLLTKTQLECCQVLWQVTVINHLFIHSCGGWYNHCQVFGLHSVICIYEIIFCLWKQTWRSINNL